MSKNYHTLNHQITCIDTQHIRKNFVAAYLIQSGDELAFVDTGSYLCVPLLLQVLQDKGLSTLQVNYIFVTHIHLDHAGGAGELVRHCPNAKVVVHQNGAQHLINPTKLKAGVMQVYGQVFFKQHLGDIIPINAAKIHIAGEEILYLGKRKLQLINTPGHARHHYCIWDELSKGIFSGDTLGVSYAELNAPDHTLIFPPTSPSQFQPELWHKSIDTLLALQPDFAYLTHFCQIPFNVQVAIQLKNRLQDFCQIAQDITHKIPNKKAQHYAIKKSLATYFLAVIKLHPIKLKDKEALITLKDDIEICTQGLMRWLDYNAIDTK